MGLDKIVQHFINEAHSGDSYPYMESCNDKLLSIGKLISHENRMKEVSKLLRLLHQAECNKCRETVLQILEQLKDLRDSKP